jgi:hypothetical protein
MCGNAVFCVSRTYCSSAPAAAIASEIVGTETAQVQVPLIRQQTPRSRTRMPGRAHVAPCGDLAEFGDWSSGTRNSAGLRRRAG